EVGRALDAEQPAHAKRDVRIAGEVGIKLHEIEGDSREHDRPGKVGVRLVDELDEGGEAVADQKLQHKPTQYQPKSRLDLAGVELPPHDVAHLGEERRRPLNGAADDLRKEGRKKEEQDRIALDRLVVPVDLDQIRNQLERVVGYAKRKKKASPGVRRLERDDNGRHGGDAG